jgi:uncharacterized protein (DUF1778 family)
VFTAGAWYTFIVDDEEIERWKRMAENPEVMYVTADEFEQLEEALNAPAEPNPKLVELLRRPSVFEENPEDSPTGP